MIGKVLLRCVSDFLALDNENRRVRAAGEAGEAIQRSRSRDALPSPLMPAIGATAIRKRQDVLAVAVVAETTDDEENPSAGVKVSPVRRTAAKSLVIRDCPGCIRRDRENRRPFPFGFFGDWLDGRFTAAGVP